MIDDPTTGEGDPIPPEDLPTDNPVDDGVRGDLSVETPKEDEVPTT